MTQPMPYSDQPTSRVVLARRLAEHADRIRRHYEAGKQAGALGCPSPQTLDLEEALREGAKALGQPHMPIQSVELDGAQERAISEAACAFVQTLHGGEGIVDALIELMEIVSGVDGVDLSGPVGGFAAQVLRH